MMNEQMEQKATQLDEKVSSQVEVSNVNKTQTKAVSIHEDKGFSAVNLFDDKQLVAAENYIKRIIRSEKSGIKSVEDGLAILMRAQDLGLPFSTCIEHIHVINGKTGVDIHVIKALLLKAGCKWKLIKNYQPLYEYTDGINVYIDGSFPDYAVRCKSKEEAEDKLKAANDDKVYIYPVKWYKDFNGNTYRDYQLSQTKFAIVVNRSQCEAVAKQGKIPVYRVPSCPVDYITEYEITRSFKDGKEMTSTGKFSYSDAIAADMFTKDTYKKYPKVLISHRAFTYAARDIASDILFGVMETTELKIVSGQTLNDDDIIEVQAETID